MRTKEINYLIKNGTKVQGNIIQIVQAFGIKGEENAVYYRLIVALPNSNNNPKAVLSDKIKDLNKLSLGKNIQATIPIAVYINKLNPKKYYVDISQLPKNNQNNPFYKNLILSYDVKFKELSIDVGE